MFDPELERALSAQAAEVEIAIAKGMEVAGAAQAVARTGARWRLAGMVDEQDGAPRVPSEGAEAVEDGGHLGGRIFVRAVHADERIEDEEHGPAPGHGGGQALEAVREAHDRLDDQVHRQRG
jgi:hypothetical protein